MMHPGPATTRSRPPVAALLAVISAVATVLALAPPAAAATPPYDAVVDLTFPVAGANTYVDSYDADRDGGARQHKATDVMAAYGMPVHAAVGGTVSWITGIGSAVPSYGYMVTIAGDDGRAYSYIHLGRQDLGPDSAYVAGIRRGVRVERGQQLGMVGCSGNASCSAPHLHFEISDPAVVDPYGTHRMNPYASLRAAQERGDLPGAIAPPRLKAPSCAPGAAVPTTPVRRIGSGDAVATSAAVAEAGWSRAREALVATAGDYADALTGAALAAELDAPLLLVGDTLAEATRSTLVQLGVRRVTILGGDAAVSTAVEDALAGTVSQVERVSGRDRFATAAQIRSQLQNTGGEVALALGTNPDPNRAWPDAIAAGALAGGARTIPVLLAAPHRLPADTVTALGEARAEGVTGVIAIGGDAALSGAVVDRVEGLGLPVTRLSGRDRYATSLAVVAAAAERGANRSGTLVAASGAAYTDALPAGPLAARMQGSLLLVPPCTLDAAPGVEEYLRGRYGDGYVVGTVRAVSEGVREVLTHALSG